MCAVCGVTAALQLCAGCGQVAYCGRAHQVMHWKEQHKMECKKAQAAKKVPSKGEIEVILQRHRLPTVPMAVIIYGQ
jgi:hypothetical protein